MMFMNLENLVIGSTLFVTDFVNTYGVLFL